MANKLIPIDLKQIISLRLDGMSNRKTAEFLGIGRNAVNASIKLFEACGLTLSELKQLENHQLLDFFPSLTTIDNTRYERLMQYFDKVNHARDHPGFTFLYHCFQYQHQEPEAYVN